jgi:hypothetical protein
MDSLLSFPVGLFHPLQHAGLSWRSPGCRLSASGYPLSDGILMLVQPDQDVINRWSDAASFWEKHREIIRQMFAPVGRGSLLDAAMRDVRDAS